ncbi:MAG: hypothetical protein JW927_12610 [Deltaproteobacteria bacterium]|nr:hypothetical protein [Deltaproteobacteria bacterium]
MKTPKEFVRLIRESEIITNPGVDDRILQDARNELAKRQQDRIAPIGVLWRTLMKTKKTAFITASMIVIVALIVFQFVGNPVGPGLTFAQVIEPILKSDIYSFDLISGSKDGGEPLILHCLSKGLRFRLEGNFSAKLHNFSTKMICIYDLQNERILTLVENGMQAQYIGYKGFVNPQDKNLQNPMKSLKDQITFLKNDPDVTVKELGLRKMDGHDSIGFYAYSSNSDTTIWSDVKTELPVQIEINRGQVHLIFRNWKFDIPEADDLLSMEVPAGYTVIGEALKWDREEMTEEKFIEGLKLIAEKINYGEFILCKSFKDINEWLENVFYRLDAMNFSKEEAVNIRQSIDYVNLFLSDISTQGNWIYRGQGVRVGEADTPIFWYKPKGSETYRVIYGDLHVENVDSEDLPE